MKSSINTCIITCILLTYLVTLSTCFPAQIRATQRRKIRDTCDGHKLQLTEKVLQQLKKQNPTQPCIGRYHTNTDPSRIPEVIPHIVCPKDSGNQCVQIELPMTVSIKTPKGKHVPTNILVPSGCIEVTDQKLFDSISRKPTHHKTVKGR